MIHLFISWGCTFFPIHLWFCPFEWTSSGKWSTVCIKTTFPVCCRHGNGLAMREPPRSCTCGLSRDGLFLQDAHQGGPPPQDAAKPSSVRRMSSCGTSNQSSCLCSSGCMDALCPSFDCFMSVLWTLSPANSLWPKWAAGRKRRRMERHPYVE